MTRIPLISLLILLACLPLAAQAPGNNCPVITIAGPGGITRPGEPIIFTAGLGNHSEPDKLRYEWTISGGSLVSGQGTSRIEIGTTAVNDGTNITAWVKIEGLPPGCSDTASEITGVGGIHDEFPLDEFGMISDKHLLKARIDNLFIRLDQNPVWEGVFITRFNKKESRSFKIGYLKNIHEAIVSLRRDPRRVSFILSEEGAELKTTMWLRPANASREMFGTSDSIFIKGEELKAKLKTLFTKKAH